MPEVWVTAVFAQRQAYPVYIHQWLTGGCFGLTAVGKFLVMVIATVLIDISSPFKRARWQTDLERLLAFCEDHSVEKLLSSI